MAAQTSVWVRGVDFGTFLDLLLLGTEFSYYLDEGIYIFGGKAGESASSTVEVVGMRHRSVNNLAGVIPNEMSGGIQVREFPDLNSVILSGDIRGVSRVKAFLRSIDRRVPLVSIEVMIFDATKQRVKDIGVDAGFGKSDVKSGGSLAGVDVSLNSADINRIINRLNGFGSVNLGQVGSGFYMNLQFLEDNGIIEMQSTPKLSTLNGHETTLKSGETRYYKEMANNYYGSQIPMTTESYVWKPVDANLEIKINGIAERVKARRLEKDLTQRAFAARAGVGYDAYRKFERTGEITLRNLVQCALVLEQLEGFNNLFTTRQYDVRCHANREGQRNAFPRIIDAAVTAAPKWEPAPEGSAVISGNEPSGAGSLRDAPLHR